MCHVYMYINTVGPNTIKPTKTKKTASGPRPSLPRERRGTETAGAAALQSSVGMKTMSSQVPGCLRDPRGSARFREAAGGGGCVAGSTPQHGHRTAQGSTPQRLLGHNSLNGHQTAPNLKIQSIWGTCYIYIFIYAALFFWRFFSGTRKRTPTPSWGPTPDIDEPCAFQSRGSDPRLCVGKLRQS